MVTTKGIFFDRSGAGSRFSSGSSCALLDENSERIRDADADPELLEWAYARHVVELKEAAKALPVETEKDPLVEQVCAMYLTHLKQQVQFPTDAKELANLWKNPKGILKTYVDRGQTLFDFCSGLPCEFFCNQDQEKREARIKERKPEQIHEGYGKHLCSELLPMHVTDWLGKHRWTPSGRRTRVQALKRAFNYAVEMEVLNENPIKGFKIPRSVSRVTYLTPEQEAAILETASLRLRGGDQGLHSDRRSLRVRIRGSGKAACEGSRRADGVDVQGG